MDYRKLAELKKIRNLEQLKVIEYFDPVVKSPIAFISIGKFIPGFVIGLVIGLFIEIIIGVHDGIVFAVSWITFGIIGAVVCCYMYKEKPSITMTDTEYDALIQSKIADSKKKALTKIGLDEDEVKEIDPVDFEGYQLGTDPEYTKKRADETFVSSNYVKTWLFFSNAQIYIWIFNFHLDRDKEKENTQEFFYKDVTSLNTSSEYAKTKILIPPKGLFSEENIKEEEVSSTTFELIVPGDKITVPMENTEANNNRVQAMKQKLREKKA
jgi:hypothetical protein